MKKIIKICIVLVSFYLLIVDVNATGSTLYWAVDGNNCTYSSESCTLIMSNNEISGEHFDSGSFDSHTSFNGSDQKSPWFNYRNSITNVQIGNSNDIIAPYNTAFWFYDFTRITFLDLSYLDTSNVTDMAFMFNSCLALSIISVSDKWDTSNVTSSEGMFFTGSSNLFGMNGTFKEELDKTDKTYARVDRENERGLLWDFVPNDIYWAIDQTSSGTDLTISNNPINGDHIYSGVFKGEYAPWQNHGTINNIYIGGKNDIIKPYRTTSWFAYFNISGLNMKYFDTSNVFDMSEMFYHSSGTIGLQYLNTSKVKYMSGMFFHASMTINNLNKIDTSNVISMANMFNDSNCYNLDLSNFNTSNVVNMSNMFSNCGAYYLDVSSFDTSNVKNMNYMFANNSYVTNIVLGDFNTSKLEEASGMFKNDTNLQRIFVNNDFSNETTSDDMFYNDSNISGMNGTKYDSTKVNATYARIDRDKNPGYFWKSNIVYWAVDGENCEDEKSNCSLKISGKKINGNHFDSGTLKMYDIYNVDSEYGKYKPSITSISIGGENDIIKPYTITNWFSGLNKIESISFKYLDTSYITNMSQLLYGCANLKNIEFANFNTSKVTNMDSMFYGCKKLNTIDLSSFDTSKVITMARMFTDTGFISLDLSNFNTSRLISMSYMFSGMSKVKQINLSSFDTSRVSGMPSLFAKDAKLSNVIVSEDWDASFIQNTSNMFENCINIVGMNGTKFNSNKTDGEYAKIDKQNEPGYFWDHVDETVDVTIYGDIQRLDLEDMHFNNGYLVLRYKKYPEKADPIQIEVNTNYEASAFMSLIRYYTEDNNSVGPSDDWLYLEVEVYLGGDGTKNIVIKNPNDNTIYDEINKDFAFVYYNYYENNDRKMHAEFRMVDDSIAPVINSIEYYSPASAVLHTNMINTDLIIVNTSSNIGWETKSDQNGDIKVNSPTDGEYRIIKLIPNSMYSSKWSNKVSYTSPNISTSTIKPTITIEKIDSNSIKLNFLDDAAFDFILDRSTNKKSWKRYPVIKEHYFIDSDLKYGTTYYYRVQENLPCIGTGQTCGYSTYSDIVSVKIVPDKVENVRIISSGSTNIKIGYDKVGVTGYQIQRSTKPNSGFKKVTFVTKNSTLSYNNKKLKNATTYYYRVRAYKTVKGKKVYGEWSDVVSATTGPSTPKKPSIKALNYNTITLKLKSAKTASYYEVSRSTNKKKGYTTIAAISELSFTDTVEPGTTYYYKTRACNALGVCSGWTGQVNKKTGLSKPTLSGVPEVTVSVNEEGKEIKTGKVTLTVGSVDGATGYVIQRSTKKNKGFKNITETTNLSVEDNGVKAGKTYWYRIRAYRVVGTKKVYSGYTKPIKVVVK